MSGRDGVTVVGSLNEDVVASVQRLPGRGETVIAGQVRTSPGGKGANQAAAAARLGPGVRMVGRVGRDDAGARMLDALADAGADVGEVVAVAEPTGSATIAVERGTGENLILVVPGANGSLAPADVDLASVRQAGVVLLQLEVPLATVAAAAARATGRVVLNPAPPQPLPDTLLGDVDVLVPNEHELVQLTGGVDATSADGTPAESDPAAGEHADTVVRAERLRLRCREGAAVVVTLGARGALLVTGHGPVLLQTPPEVDVVDATGAGDCFCGALSWALASGASLPDAVRSAVAAASASTTGPGARSALPDAAAVQALLGRMTPPRRV